MITADARERYARDPACRHLGITLDEAGAGRARVRMRVTEVMANMHGLAHGGFLFLLADAAFAYACNAAGPVTVAHGAQVTFLRPVEVGEELTAEAVQRARYGPNGIYDVTVSRPGGEVVAEFRGHSVALARRPTTEQGPPDRSTRDRLTNRAGPPDKSSRS
ncbi:hydroxyphenylacetyl-CoA thioesterase PaaI [Micromonospora zhanjiangensis]